MKKLMAIVCALMLGALAFADDPAEGFWISVDEKSGKETAGWQVFQDGGKLCGKILSVANEPQDAKPTKAKGKSYDNFMNGADVSTLTIVGTAWIWGLQKKNEGAWKDGYVIDPNDGKRYKCEITFHKADGKKYPTDTLEMRGKVGPVGRSQFWKKADESQATGLR
ncbi:MAG: DUF2147 domain-containing protein [Treponema sp.]|nr:DUF2147 domain-containing protein [Treponema sp.]